MEKTIETLKPDAKSASEQLTTAIDELSSKRNTISILAIIVGTGASITIFASLTRLLESTELIFSVLVPMVLAMIVALLGRRRVKEYDIQQRYIEEILRRIEEIENSELDEASARQELIHSINLTIEAQERIEGEKSHKGKKGDG